VSNEFKHTDVGTELSKTEWEATDTHEADGQTANDMLYFNGTYWIRATPATIRGLLSIDTDDIPQYAGIELGHASDTTLTRSAAGVLAVEGTDLLQADGSIALAGSIDIGDDVFFRFGGVASLGWETADANANALILALPNGGAVDVPVFVIGNQSILNADLGMFNGYADPCFIVFNSDCDGYMRFQANGFYVKPSSDDDIYLFQVGVTDLPTVFWDESEDNFAFSKGLGIAGNIVVTGTVDGVDIAGHAVDADAHHNQQHSIISTDDHTSAATEGQILKADANGLPVDATNTDAELSADHDKLAGIEAGADVTADNAPKAHTASHAVGGADAVFPADPGADKYLMWDDSETALAWADAGISDIDAYLENPPTEDEAHKAPTSEWAFDHDAATTGVHGVTGTIVGTSDSQVLTTKTLIATSNVMEEITTVASSATPTPTGGSLRNFFTVTALAAGATFAAPSGTPANSNKLIIRIKDNGTARALAWNAIYRAMEFALPTTTIISKTIYLGFIYNSTDSKWDLVAINEEA